MNCRRARQNIALFAGNDLDPLTARELHQHLKICRECECHWKTMKASVEALQAPARDPMPLHDSVWPGLSARLAQRARVGRPHRFNGWAPALVVVAACLMMLLFAQGTPQAVDHAGSPVRATPASTLSPWAMRDDAFANGFGGSADLSVEELKRDQDDFRRMLDELRLQPRTRTQSTPDRR